MNSIVFTNSRGQEVTLTNRPPFILYKVEGLGSVDAENSFQKSPNQDGSSYIDTVLEERLITFDITIKGSNHDEISMYRQLLSSVFNPKLGEGTLTYRYGNTLRKINAIAESVPIFPGGLDNRGKTFQRVQVNLICPNPYWKSNDVITEPLAAFLPKFKFPFTFPVQFGERGSQAILNNDGDVPCPIEIEFNGPATNPIITNLTTGEFILVKRQLLEGEKLIINTSEGRNRRVVIDHGNGIIENAWGYIDIWESTLFKLDVGENIISYDALSSGGQAVVTINFRNLYVGV